MKNQTIIICVLLTVLIACTPAAPLPSTEVPVPKSITPLASATTPVTTAPEKIDSCSATLTSVPVATAEFTIPEPDVWAMLMKPVREYFFYRKKAVVEGNIQVLWDRYPDLKQGPVLPKGINAEASLVENMKGLKPFDGNVSPESYERIKVFLKDKQAEILVHGTELFLFKEQSQFQDSGGEFKILLFVCSQDNQQWTVYKTDEVTQAEWNGQSP